MSSSEPEFNDAREYSSLEEVMNTLLTAKGKSFRELDQTGRALTGGNKGSLGQIIEESVLKYAINSDAAPDIHIGDTSYELKVTPLKHIKKGKQTSAKERLVIDIINYLTLATRPTSNLQKCGIKRRISSSFTTTMIAPIRKRNCASTAKCLLHIS